MYSRHFDRVKSCIQNELDDSEVIELWNHFADQSGYEHIYSMDDFDEIIGGDRPYNEVKKTLADCDDFDDSDPYFFMNDSTGQWVSTEEPVDAVVDIDQLVDALVECKGEGYPSSPLDDIFDGYAFNEEIKETLCELSAEEFDAMAAVLSQYGYPVGSPKESMIDDIVDALSEAKGVYSYHFVYLLPEKVQEKFFEFIDPGLGYLTENIGKKGTVPVERALNIAGFFKPHSNGDLYIQKASGKYHRYTIKIKNGAIKSAEPENKKKQTTCR